MEFLYSVLFLFLLAFMAWQDHKTRKVSDFGIVISWFLLYLSGSAQMNLAVGVFPLIWFGALLRAGAIGWADITILPVFAVFTYEMMLRVVGSIYFVPFIILTIVLAYLFDRPPMQASGFFRFKKLKQSNPFFVELFFVYIIWLIGSVLM